MTRRANPTVCSHLVATFLVGSLAMALMGSLVSAQTKEKLVAGKADVLRHVPKKFATLLGVDVEKSVVAIKIEGEDKPSSWSVNRDAEIRIQGTWGRLEQFEPGDRLWIWFAIDRDKQPSGILMLADELSEQLLHGLPHRITAFDKDKRLLSVTSEVSGARQLSVADVDGDIDPQEVIGKQAYLQTAGTSLRILASDQQFAQLQKRQQQTLRKIWRDEGLPGTVTFLHPLSGEMEIMLDHEAIRWGRYLKNGDQVSLSTDKPISASVKRVEPWRERTLLRLVTASGVDQFDLSLGQRVGVHVPEPPSDIQQSSLPTDIGRRTSKQERVEWFLASTYCGCKIAGDRCTGMFYTLASCNVNACGMPNRIRKQVEEMIDEGLSDAEIWQKLLEWGGPDFMKQHLLR